MPTIGKAFILLGLICLAVGGLILVGGRIPWLGHLPGDIVIKRDHFSFYFPLTTCLILSLLGSLLWHWFHR